MTNRTRCRILRLTDFQRCSSGSASPTPNGRCKSFLTMISRRRVIGFSLNLPTEATDGGSGSPILWATVKLAAEMTELMNVDHSRPCEAVDRRRVSREELDLTLEALADPFCDSDRRMILRTDHTDDLVGLYDVKRVINRCARCLSGESLMPLGADECPCHFKPGPSFRV